MIIKTLFVRYNVLYIYTCILYLYKIFGGAHSKLIPCIQIISGDPGVVQHAPSPPHPLNLIEYGIFVSVFHFYQNASKHRCRLF